MQFLDSVKNSAMAPVVGAQLCQSQYQDQVRFFGLGVMEHCVRYNWSLFNVEQRAQIRQLMTELILQSGISDARRYLQDKMAHVFAELCEREWPQHWPQMDLTLQ